MSRKSKKEPQYPKALHHSLWQLRHSRTLYLPGWQFDSVIKPHLIEIEKKAIYDNEYPDAEIKYAFVYGLKAIQLDTKESTCAALFVRYESHLHQVNTLEDVQEFYELLRRFWIHDAGHEAYWKWKDEQKIEK